MATTGRKPYFATSYHDMMRHIYAKPKGHSEGRKPYMEDDYFNTEYPQLKKYNGKELAPTEEPPIEPPIEPPTECLEWFENTIIVSGNDYFQNPAFIDKIYADIDECTKLHLIILSCMYYNSLSFCICCASAAMEAGGGFTTQSSCAQDFGPVADEPWKCCSPPCPSFSIEVLSEDTNTVCYKATADCDIRVLWERKIGTEPWGYMDQSGCTDRPVCGGQVKATDLCGNEVTASLPGTTTSPGVISCTGTCDTTTKSTTKQFTYTPCSCAYDTEVWSVSGTGATIDQSGLLTTDSSACGTIQVSVSQGGCSSATQAVRVTDGGTWVLGSRTYPANACNSYWPATCVADETCTVVSGGTMVVSDYQFAWGWTGSYCADPRYCPSNSCTTNSSCGTGLMILNRCISTYTWECP